MIEGNCFLSHGSSKCYTPSKDYVAWLLMRRVKVRRLNVIGNYHLLGGNPEIDCTGLFKRVESAYLFDFSMYKTSPPIFSFLNECADHLRTLDMVVADVTIVRTLLKHCPVLTNLYIQKIAKSEQDIFELELEGFDASSSFCLQNFGSGGGTFSNTLTRRLRCCPELHTLQIENNDFSNAGEIILILQSCPSLTSVSFNNAAFVTDGVLAALSSESTGPNIKHLSLKGMQDVSPLAIVTMCKGLPNIELINLSDVSVLVDDALAELAKSSPKLTTVQMATCPLIDTDGVNNLLRSCKALHHVDFSYNANVYLKDFVHCKSLTMLQLVECRLVGNDGLEPDEETGLLVSAHSLEHLDLSRCYEVVDTDILMIMEANPNVHTLNISSCNHLTDTMCGGILNMSHLNKLTHLDVSYCYNLSSAMLAVVVSKCPLLKRFAVRYCHAMQDDLLDALGNHCPLLEIFDAPNCRHFSDMAICNMAAKCVHILQLDFCGLDKLGDIAVTAVCTYCTQLQLLNISSCSRLTDVGYKSLTNCKYLHWLCINNSLNLTKTTADLIIDKCKLSLQVLDIKMCLCAHQNKKWYEQMKQKFKFVL